MTERARARLIALLSLPLVSKMDKSIFATKLEMAISIVKKIRSPPKDIADLLEKAVNRELV